MTCGIDARAGAFYYKDLNKIVSGQPRHNLSNLVNGSDNLNLVFEFGVAASPGSGNQSAYGVLASSYSVKDGADTGAGKSVVNKLDKNSINVNRSLAKDSSRIILPLDVNDRQEELLSSRHNRVGISTFSTKAEFLLRTGSGIRMFDLVTAHIYDTESKESDISGSYVVEGVVLAATPVEYVEKICCISNTVNQVNSELTN
jgi:hypothetical protein